MIDPNDPGTLDLVEACAQPLTGAQRAKRAREKRNAQQIKPVMLNEVERQLLAKVRALGAGMPEFVQVPRPGNGDFETLEVADACVLSVWANLSSDFSRASTALGVLRLRNSQHAELVSAVAVLQERLRRAGLSDLVSASRKQWHWNESPPADYRVSGPRDYMERQSVGRSVADQRDALARELEAVRREQALLESERNKAFESNRVLTERLRRAGLCTDYRAQPGE